MIAVPRSRGGTGRGGLRVALTVFGILAGVSTGLVIASQLDGSS
jgi:hypothetical protein